MLNAHTHTSRTMCTTLTNVHETFSQFNVWESRGKNDSPYTYISKSHCDFYFYRKEFMFMCVCAPPFLHSNRFRRTRREHQKKKFYSIGCHCHLRYVDNNNFSMRSSCMRTACIYLSLTLAVGMRARCVSAIFFIIIFIVFVDMCTWALHLQIY